MGRGLTVCALLFAGVGLTAVQSGQEGGGKVDGGQETTASALPEVAGCSRGFYELTAGGEVHRDGVVREGDLISIPFDGTNADECCWMQFLWREIAVTRADNSTFRPDIGYQGTNHNGGKPNNVGANLARIRPESRTAALNPPLAAG